MMEHTEIRRKLSAYLENTITAGEREEIRRHLADCGSCRVTLANLELTLGRRYTPAGAGPPRWLIDKITRKQRAAAGVEPGIRQRLRLLRQVKLPLGACAVALLCVIGYYLTATDSYPPASRTSVEEPSRLPSAQPKSPDLRPSAPGAEIPLPPALFEAPASSMPHKHSAPPLPSLPPPPALPGQSLAEPGLQPADEEAPAERTSEPADLGWGSIAAEPAAVKAEVVLRVTDNASAAAAIEQAVGTSGGTVVGHASNGGSHFLAAQIEAPRLEELTGRLGKIGRVRERPQLSAGAEGKVDLIIRW